MLPLTCNLPLQYIKVKVYLIGHMPNAHTKWQVHTFYCTVHYTSMRYSCIFSLPKSKPSRPESKIHIIFSISARNFKFRDDATKRRYKWFFEIMTFQSGKLCVFFGNL